MPNGVQLSLQESIINDAQVVWNPMFSILPGVRRFYRILLKDKVESQLHIRITAFLLLTKAKNNVGNMSI